MHVQRLRSASMVALALSAVACSQAGTPGDEEDDEAITAAGCGVERWSVKTGTDAAAAQVNMTAQDTTIAAMRARPVPAGLSSGSARFAGTAETQLFRLTGVTLVQYKLESDSDYHLVLSDAAGQTMIAEIPKPSCVSGGPWAQAITAARAGFDAKYTPTGSFQSANVPVTITGVGFFDLQHGQTGVAPNAIELHAVLGICFPGSPVSGCTATKDFSLSANPSSVGGASASSAIAVAGSNGFSGTVALSAGGLPAGASASFSPAAVAAGGSSTLSLNAGSAAAGTYTVTVTGTSGVLSHTAQVNWTVGNSGGGSGLVNGGFETGSLSGWTVAGQAAVVSSGAHGGTHAARVGSTSPSTSSSLTQAVTLPPAAQLTFWVKVICPDTIQFDWASVQVKSASGAVLATPLPNTCSNSGAWVQKSADLSAFAGQTVTLSFNNHDDNFSGDATYTLYDDIALSGAAPDFSLSLASASESGAATDSVTVTPAGGFSGPVALSVSGVPTGASASFSPASISSGSSALTLSPGTAANGTYSLTVSGAGGGLTHTAPLSWTLSSGGGGGGIQTVFVILMENHNWTQIAGSASAPYINGTLLPQASSAQHYLNPPGIHPSLPNYLWLEAGTNFGILNDNAPSSNHQGTTQHLVTQLQNAGIPWKAYEESIGGATCPLTTSGLFAPKHLAMLYFDDVTNTNNASSANCVQHVRPFSELAADLSNNTVARYNFITPDLCDDMHNPTGCATTDEVKNGDTWLSQNVPAILASAAFRNNGLLLITWDESEGGDVPIGLIALSPKAKGHGYVNSIPYTHSSTLRSLQEIFAVRPFLGDAANATDLSDLFTSFP